MVRIRETVVKSELGERVHLRVDPGHKRLWVTAAALDGRGLSAWLRWLAARRLDELARGDDRA